MGAYRGPNARCALLSRTRARPEIANVQVVAAYGTGFTTLSRRTGVTTYFRIAVLPQTRRGATSPPETIPRGEFRITTEWPALVGSNRNAKIAALEPFARPRELFQGKRIRPNGERKCAETFGRKIVYRPDVVSREWTSIFNISRTPESKLERDFLVVRAGGRRSISDSGCRFDPCGCGPKSAAPTEN